MVTVVKGPRGGPQSMGKEDTDFILQFVNNLGTISTASVASDVLVLPECVFSSEI